MDFSENKKENRMSWWEKCNYTTISKKLKKNFKIIKKHTQQL